MAIKGLPNFTWVYKGQPDPVTGNIATTRYAKNLLTGETLTVREAQTRQAGGIPYEKRVLPSQRKTYRRKVSKGHYLRYGPFYSPGAANSGTSGDIGPRTPVLLLVYGVHKGKGSIKAGHRYASVSGLMDYATMQQQLHKLATGQAATTPEEKRIQRNLSDFEQVERYYILRKL